MKKLYFLVVIFIYVSSFSQTYEYNFNNSLAEQGGSGPTLTEYLTNGAAAGSYSSQSITTSQGTCGTQTTYNFNVGGGLEFDNSSSFIGTSYTINVLLKWNTLPGGTWYRVIDFDTTTDNGIYSKTGGCIRFSPVGPSFYGSCPNQTSGNFTLFTLVRDAATDSAYIFVDGALSESYFDGTGLYVPPTATSPILFFIDNTGDVENGDGSIRYLSLTASASTPAQVLNTWNTLCNTVLPLHLVDFSANKQSSSVNLSWTTVNEVNADRFEVEKSSDGNNFNKLADVQAKNTPTTNKYGYVDTHPSLTNFYRLKMVDIDGHFTYSAILKISFSGNQKFEIYPNPALNTITITGVNENQIVRVFNIQGNELLEKKASGQSLTIDISKYPSGVYMVQYFDGEKMQNKKLIKE